MTKRFSTEQKQELDKLWTRAVGEYFVRCISRVLPLCPRPEFVDGLAIIQRFLAGLVTKEDVRRAYKEFKRRERKLVNGYTVQSQIYFAVKQALYRMGHLTSVASLKFRAVPRPSTSRNPKHMGGPGNP